MDRFEAASSFFVLLFVTLYALTIYAHLTGGE
jgi:hypothetical protein